MQSIASQPTHSFLLIVEDSDEDYASFMRITRQLSLAHPVFRCRDGDEILAWLQETGKNPQEGKALHPSLILLDLNLPGTDGREVLHQLKQNPNWKQIPTVVFTTSANPRDVEFCYRKGVKSYIVKPIDLDQLRKTIRIFWDYWFDVVTLPFASEP